MGTISRLGQVFVKLLNFFEKWNPGMFTSLLLVFLGHPCKIWIRVGNKFKGYLSFVENIGSCYTTVAVLLKFRFWKWTVIWVSMRNKWISIMRVLNILLGQSVGDSTKSESWLDCVGVSASVLMGVGMVWSTRIITNCSINLGAGVPLIKV